MWLNFARWHVTMQLLHTIIKCTVENGIHFRSNIYFILCYYYYYYWIYWVWVWTLDMTLASLARCFNIILLFTQVHMGTCEGRGWYCVWKATSTIWLLRAVYSLGSWERWKRMLLAQWTEYWCKADWYVIVKCIIF